MSKASIVALGVLCAVTLASGNTPNRCVGQPEGRFINDFTDCEAFFTCVRQTPVPGRCPPGFYFNEAAQICDNPWNVICLLCVEPLEPDEDPDTPDSPFFFAPIKNECRKYTFCVNGVGFLQECGPGLMFDQVASQCDVETNVECEESVCPNNINPEVPTLVPNPWDCASYFICFRREPLDEQPVRCNDGLLFNPITRQCDFAENVECQEIPEPETPTTCPSTGLHYIPEQGSCDSYFICVNGDKIGPMFCAEGLIFDINTRNCRPENDPEAVCITDTRTVALRKLLMGPKV